MLTRVTNLQRCIGLIVSSSLCAAALLTRSAVRSSYIRLSSSAFAAIAFTAFCLSSSSLRLLSSSCCHRASRTCCCRMATPDSSHAADTTSACTEPLPHTGLPDRGGRDEEGAGCCLRSDTSDVTYYVMAP